MSVRVMTWVFEQSRSKKNARLVLLAIADCANDEGSQAYPSMTKLKQKTGLGDRAVTNLVADLEKLGELVVHRNAGPRGCNLYQVVMTPAESAPPQNLHPRRKRQAPPQKTTGTPAESAPGTIKEPSTEPSFKNTVAETLPLIEPEAEAAKKPRTKKSPADPAGDSRFMRWYATYPNAVKRPVTYAAWLKAITRIDPERLQELTEAYAKAYAASGNDPQYIPMSTTWLNQERWGDPLPRNRASPNGHQPYKNPDDSSIYEGAL